MGKSARKSAGQCVSRSGQSVQRSALHVCFALQWALPQGSGLPLHLNGQRVHWSWGGGCLPVGFGLPACGAGGKDLLPQWARGALDLGRGLPSGRVKAACLWGREGRSACQSCAHRLCCWQACSGAACSGLCPELAQASANGPQQLCKAKLSHPRVLKFKSHSHTPGPCTDCSHGFWLMYLHLLWKRVGPSQPSRAAYSCLRAAKSDSTIAR